MPCNDPVFYPPYPFGTMLHRAGAPGAPQEDWRTSLVKMLGGGKLGPEGRVAAFKSLGCSLEEARAYVTSRHAAELERLEELSREKQRLVKDAESRLLGLQDQIDRERNRVENWKAAARRVREGVTTTDLAMQLSDRLTGLRGPQREAAITEFLEENTRAPAPEPTTRERLSQAVMDDGETLRLLDRLAAAKLGDGSTTEQASYASVLREALEAAVARLPQVKILDQAGASGEASAEPMQG